MKIRLKETVDDPAIKTNGEQPKAGDVCEVDEIKANALIRAGVAVEHVSVETANIETWKPKHMKKGKFETPEG